MSLSFHDGQRAKIKKIVEQHEKYSVVHLTTSRKRTDYEKERFTLKNEKNKFLTGDYAYSQWSFVRVVGKANITLQGLAEGDVVEIISGNQTQEPYEDKDGNVVYPKNVQRVIFDWTLYRGGSGNRAAISEEDNVDLGTDPVLPPEDDIPF